MLHTLSKTIDAGYLTTFTSITSQQVRRYPHFHETTVKGHLKDIKKWLRYAQIPSLSINNTTSALESNPKIIEEYDSDDDQTPTPNPSITTPATPSPISSPTILPTATPNDNALAYDIFEQLIKPSKRTSYFYSGF